MPIVRIPRDRYHSDVALDKPIVGATYFKRFRMELDLQAPLPAVPGLPRGLQWLPWTDDLLERHALVKFQSFCDEMDGFIFPNLGCHDGCLRLMRDIRRRLVHETCAPRRVVRGAWTVHGWPVHRADWKGEILRSVVDESGEID